MDAPRGTSIRGGPANRRKAPRRSPAAASCRRKFLHYFPGGFRDPSYLEWERGYKVAAHERWRAELGDLGSLIAAGRYREVAARAVAIESRTNLLFSFEKMALRDAVRPAAGARAFAKGLHELLAGRGDLPHRFDHWVEIVEALPRRQTRVLSWPLVTVFGFIARPKEHIFLKPNVTRRAAERYGFDFAYQSRPSFATYQSLLAFAAKVRRDVADLRPRDMIDLQSFIWVLGSDEYPD